MLNLGIGDTITRQGTIGVKEILAVYPVEYNGMTDRYTICEPSKATHNYVLITEENDGYSGIIIEINNSSGLLFDMVQK